MEHIITNAITGETTIVPYTEAEIAAAKLASKKAELKALLEQYNSSQESLQKAWTAACFTGGEGKDARVADIKAELADIDAQYLIDVAAVKAKYL